MGDIDFEESAIAIERMIRGLNPWPSAYTTLQGKTLKIWEATVADELNIENKHRILCGEIVRIEPDCIWVATKIGFLGITEMQLEGKKRMRVDSFLRGYSLEIGMILGR